MSTSKYADQLRVDRKTVETSDDQTFINVNGINYEWEDPEGRIAHVSGETEGTTGRAMWEIENEGKDLEIVAITVSMSEGGEDNRAYLDAGYDYVSAGTATVTDAFLQYWGAGGDQDYNRGSEEFVWPEDSRPVLRHNDSIYVNINMSNPNNTDTTKAFFEVHLRAIDDGDSRL
jgi:hypothetical protein